jgi:hypothetical protein
MADQGTSDPRMSEHLRQMLASMRETVRPWLPKRMRGGGAVVPVVRLSGAIGPASRWRASRGRSKRRLRPDAPARSRS